MPLNVMDTARTEKTDVLLRLVSLTIFFFIIILHEEQKTMSAFNMFGSLHHISAALFRSGGFFGLFFEDAAHV